MSDYQADGGQWFVYRWWMRVVTGCVVVTWKCWKGSPGMMDLTSTDSLRWSYVLNSANSMYRSHSQYFRVVVTQWLLSVVCWSFLWIVATVGLWDGNAPWFICWFRHCVNCLFVYLLHFLPHVLPSLLSFFSLCFLFYFLAYWFIPVYLSTLFRIDLFRFQARGCRWRPNLDLVFCVNFML